MSPAHLVCLFVFLSLKYTHMQTHYTQTTLFILLPEITGSLSLSLSLNYDPCKTNFSCSSSLSFFQLVSPTQIKHTLSVYLSNTHLFTVARKKCVSGVRVRREIRSAGEVEGGWCALTQRVWRGRVIPLGVTAVEATAGHATGHIAVLLARFEHWLTWSWGKQSQRGTLDDGLDSVGFKDNAKNHNHVCCSLNSYANIVLASTPTPSLPHALFQSLIF